MASSRIIKSVKLKPGKYVLSRESDGSGDAGPMLQSLKDPSPMPEKLHLSDLIPAGSNGEVVVGCRIQCGSLNGRSYSQQDWWLTTPVLEILEVNKDKTKLKFKTGNSVYIVVVV